MEALLKSLSIIYKNKTAFVGFIILLSFVFMATIGPILVPLDTSAHTEEMFQPPSIRHILGADYAGRDIFAEIIHGSRSVLIVGVLAALISVSISVLIGIPSGFMGGLTDWILMRITDIFLTIPSLPLLVVLAAFIRIGNPLIMSLVLSLTSWPGLARAIRSQTLSLRERDFIEAAKVSGLSSMYIVFSELLPNMAPYIAISAIFAITQAVYAQVGLFFLGLAPFTSINWGVMLNFAVSQAGALYSSRSVSYLLSPIVCISLLQISSVLFVRALEEIFNPRLQK